MNDTRIYEDIAQRTDGDIYIGIVGPVRTGKSTFIKRFMETLVIPNIENIYVKERAKDELPQSGSGKTIMTAEPKFVPEDAVEIKLENTTSLSVRLIDCVGYMIPSASGLFEDEKERMVTTPWFDHEIPITEAAETGTKKVISDHSTIGIVITSDGSATGFPREDYLDAEQRVINELKAIGKPFLIILNTASPGNAMPIAKALSEKYNVTCIPKNCLTLTIDDINEIIENILAEFPISDIHIELPEWLEAMPIEYELKSELYTSIRSAAESIYKIKDIDDFLNILTTHQKIDSAVKDLIDMGSGTCHIQVNIPHELFFTTISEYTGFDITDERKLISIISELADVKKKYDRILPALKAVEQTGYGIIMPSFDEMKLDEPEIVKKSGRYGVKLRASAPSIHLIKTEIETEVSPAVGGAGTSEEVIGLLLQGFEGDTSKIWESNLFGKSLYDIAGEDLTNKISKMPADTQQKMRNTLQRITNEGSGGVICIIL